MTQLLQITDLLSGSVAVAARIAGLALLSGVVSAAVGLLYRWYARDRVASPVAVLAGLGSIAIYLNTTVALSQVIAGTSTEILALDTALFNALAFFLAAAAAPVGARVGDRIGTDVFAMAGARQIEADVSSIVRTVGRVITVELPDDIDDIEGYDPVNPEVKEKLAGRTFVFPRRLTVNELRERLTNRLVTDFQVGHVDVDLTEDGTVEYLALGSRASGIGPTLPPGSAATAIRADPAYAASPGDRVQIWRRPAVETAEATEPMESAGSTESSESTETPGAEELVIEPAETPSEPTAPPERVTTAEVRGTAGDVVTVAADVSDVRKLDPETQYRIVTLPTEQSADKEFASLLRASDETMGVTTIEEGSPLAGAPVSEVTAAIIAVRSPGGGVEPLPPRSRPLVAGETVYAVGLPDALRKLETAATREEED